MARSPTGSHSTGTPLDSLYFLLSSSCFHCPDRVYSAGDHLGFPKENEAQLWADR
ncbi:hypothetical protein Tsubulata_029521 [Turnera subulata]|uniref:Uncharacterized protein n=1 Tax=Turnera subulata TaxID=218843 RepID=A0A9Q0JF52_9ROSI|nr:hypothetical protein Tsubulata_029521 [Turnera subulata]